ncbi:MAG: hypothetical protein U0941_19330 [Planctomycetaceae bacterium]
MTCLNCGSRTWHQRTFVDGQRQITKKLEQCLEAWLSRLTIQDAVAVFGVSWNTVCEIDIRRLKKLSRPGLPGLKRLAIDEVYLGKQHKFVTLVLDLDTRAVMSVAPGHGASWLKELFFYGTILLALLCVVLLLLLLPSTHTRNRSG